jgi:hypothetical protein
MTGLWIAISLRKSAREIREALEKWFPDLVVTDWDLSSPKRAKDALKNPIIDTADILFRVEKNESEFPTGIHFDKFPGPQDEEVIQPTMIVLARRFGNLFDCRTICDGSDHGDDDSPYWTIIWEKGKSFLADDCDTEFGDQSGGDVRIVREISLPAYALNNFGQLIV